MNNKQKTVAVFGGSFDPVTKAHVQIIEALGKKFTHVVVLPCYISPFKQEGCVASGEDRVACLRSETVHLENVKVSKWEIKREKISYSHEAVAHYREKYADAKLYFVIGSDCVAGLPDWRNADYLAQNATFYVVRRAGYPVPQKVRATLAALGFKVIYSTLEAGDFSSGAVRVAVALGKEEEYVPASTAQYIRAHGLYGEYKKYTDAYATFGLKPERIAHTFRAVKEGIRLSKIHGVNVHDAVVALLLHDIGKYASPAVLKAHNVSVPDYAAIQKEAPAVLHSFVSAGIARDYFGCPEHIVSAVKNHTCGAADMTDLDKVVYLADATEEGRDYEGVAQLRRLAASDLDRAMRKALRSTERMLKAEGRPVFGQTKEARKYFEELCRKKYAVKKAAPVFERKSAPVFEKKPASDTSTRHKKFAHLPQKGGKDMALYIAECLSDKKGQDIVLVDLADKSVIADYFVIAGANSATAVKAMADYVDEKLSKDNGIEPLRRDVSPKWAVLDYGDVIVHIQHREAREFYRLEKLWDNGTNVIPFEE